MNVRTKPLMFPIALLALAIFSVFGYAAGKVSRKNKGSTWFRSL